MQNRWNEMRRVMEDLVESTAIVAGNVSESSSGTPFARDVARGLESSPKSIPSRWLYDAEGSRLFTEITLLEEYDLTRVETSILVKSASRIASHLHGRKWKIVELGAGDGTKTEILLRSFLDANVEMKYCPIDVSSSALDVLCSRMQNKMPLLECHSIVGDNLEGLASLSADRDEGEQLFLLDLGSSVGNRSREALDALMSDVRQNLKDGDLTLTGFDLVKESERMLAAYDDARGVTRDFNLNLLARMNRELGANFDITAFKHEATWNPAMGGMESWLVSLREQVVRIQALDRAYRFQKWEPLQTETSLKFRMDQIASLAQANNYESLAVYQDDAASFVDVLWKTKSRSAGSGTRLFWN